MQKMRFFKKKKKSLTDSAKFEVPSQRQQSLRKQPLGHKKYLHLN